MSHTDFWGPDHTGNGNFMAVNGHSSSLVVWKQTVNVLPNTTYYFSAYARSLNSAGNNAQLRFSVNGGLVGNTAVLSNQPSAGPYTWTQFYGSWTSGPTTTTADIYINDLQGALSGNDFGLDDISFGTLSTFINLESAPGTDSQVVCRNTPITNIIYSVGNGNPSGPNVTGLPAGVTSVFSGDRVTISGTPTAPAGKYTYTITTTGCAPQTITGTITVQEQTLVLSAGSSSPSVCVNSPVNIGYTAGGTATSATVTGLPTGLSYSGFPVVTISGSVATAGAYPYKIITTGTCTPDTLTGTITVKAATLDAHISASNQQSNRLYQYSYYQYCLYCQQPGNQRNCILITCWSYRQLQWRHLYHQWYTNRRWHLQLCCDSIRFLWKRNR